MSCFTHPRLPFCPLLVPAWCLRSEGVSSVLLGVSSAEQLMEHLGALQVSQGLRDRTIYAPFSRSKCYAVQRRMALRSATTQASPVKDLSA